MKRKLLIKQYAASVFKKQGQTFMLGLFFILLLSITTPHKIWAQQYAYLKIEDSQQEPKAVVAGDVYDGKIYHQDLKNRDNGKWQFVPTSDGFYNIIDIRHNRAIVAGHNYDGKIYHQEASNLPEAQWKLVEKGDNKFHLIDKKHGKALVGGNVYDGKLYHQDPGLRSNAIWNLTIVEGAQSRIAPQEIVVFEKHLKTEYDINKKVLDNNSEPKTSTIQARYTNNTSRDQNQQIAESRTFTTSETWETKESISNKIWTEITAQAGWKAGSAGGMEATVSNTTGFGTTTTNEKSKGGTATISTLISFSSNTVIPPNKTTVCEQKVFSENASVPFTSTVLRTYGDGSSREKEINGIWKGTLMSRSEVTCTEQ